MSLRFALLRHGRASGQGPDATLLPEGEAYVRALGRQLAREGWAPTIAYSSPYRRARDTARLLLEELACDAPLELVHDLTPDHDPLAALEALEAHGLRHGPVLVVSHLPLVARLTQRLTGAPEDFSPGTLVELDLADDRRSGTLRRRIGPDEMDGA